MEVDSNRQMKNALNKKEINKDAQPGSECQPQSPRSAAVLRGEHPGLLLQILSHYAAPSREARTPTSLPSLSLTPSLTPSLQPSLPFVCPCPLPF